VKSINNNNNNNNNNNTRSKHEILIICWSVGNKSKQL